METIYRKVSTADRLPTKTDNYFTNKNIMAFFLEDKTFEERTVVWWLEEIDLPTENALIKEAGNRIYMTNEDKTVFVEGGKWALSVLAAVPKT